MPDIICTDIRIGQYIIDRHKLLGKICPDILIRQNQRVERILYTSHLHPVLNAPGYGSYFAGEIRISPKPIMQRFYRIPNVNPLDSTLIHEHMEALLSDSGNRNLIALWSYAFGFLGSADDDYPVCTRPNWCVSSYALQNAREDLCDSTSAWILNRSILNPIKVRFLDNLF